MTERKPREPEDHAYTGTGTTRSADSTGLQRESAFFDGDVDPAVVTGATTSSHPAAADELAINRSGSGGSGDEQDDDEGDLTAPDA